MGYTALYVAYSVFTMHMDDKVMPTDNMDYIIIIVIISKVLQANMITNYDIANILSLKVVSYVCKSILPIS